VAELLSSMTLLMNAEGISAGWRVIEGRSDFFFITKKMHNALQGEPINLSDLKTNIYEEVNFENAARNQFDHDMVIIHDPPPLPLIEHYRKTCPWIWRCHVDLSHPNRELWAYLSTFMEKYDGVILSIPEFAQKLTVPQHFFMPAIDPFSSKNRPLDDATMDDRLAHYNVPTDLPLVVQISRFDRFKDPGGVIEAFRIARRQIDCTLVLLGNVATDDTEGQEVFQSLLDAQEERIIILLAEDTSLVNTLQRRAQIVV